MRRRHFEELQPVCPVCRHAAAPSLAPLTLGHVAQEDGDHVVQGVLNCPNPACQREFPILDGIPLLIPGIRDFLAAQVVPVLLRDDLDPVLESIVGDCLGAGSAFDAMRQQVGSYTWDHYADLDPQETPSNSRAGVGADRSADAPGSILRLLASGLTLLARAAPSFASGRLLDVGCGPGRTAYALADVTSDLVLGVDLNFGMLRIGARALRERRVRYSRRRNGLAYDRREFAVDLPHRERVDFWCCDATALPFAPDSFTGATAFNVLDSTPAPLALLAALADALRPSGGLLLATPYDWSPAVTPLEQWIGGHSQRGPDRGDGPAILRRILAMSTCASGAPMWESVIEQDSAPWSVRLHERSASRYDVHLLATRLGESSDVART